MSRHDPLQVAQADEAVLPKKTIESRTAPALAGESIIIAGNRVPVSGAKIVTYKEDSSWDFENKVHFDADRKYVHPRKTEKKDIVESQAQAATVIDMVVIHADITYSARDCYRVLLSRGFSTHFMVDWDGTIYQSTDVARKAIHASSEFLPDVNGRSIGIDMNCPQMNYAKGEAPSASGALASQFAQGGERRMSEIKEINGVPWRSWGYSDLQYDALIKLLAALGRELPKLRLTAPIDERGEIIWQVPAEFDTEKIGIYGHMHLTAQKFDPGPGFDWPRVLQGLSQEHNSFPLDLIEGRTIANLLTEQKVKEVAERYYKNNESSELGGYYPIGRGGQWHAGVHLHQRVGAPVRAMFQGTVVAARNGDEPELGSNNFVLLRHEVPFDPRDDAPKFVFFSLYMHLQRFDAALDAPLEAKAEAPEGTAPSWITAAKRIDTGKLEQEPQSGDGDAGEPSAEEAGDKAAKGAKGGKGKRKGGKGTKGDKAAQGEDRRDRKGDDDEESDDDEGTDVETSDDDDDSRRFGRNFKPFLDVGKHLAALERGDVALFALSGPERVAVAAGDIVGKVGNFGDEEDEASEGVLHVEIFADHGWRQVVDLLGTHGQHWTEAQADTDDNLTIDTDDLLRTITPDSVDRKSQELEDFVFSSRVVPLDDILEFYNRDVSEDGQKAKIRQTITRHVSEWSDQVDWFKSMATAQGWDERVAELTTTLQTEQGEWLRGFFARQLYRTQPFVWLTANVAKHIGLEVGGTWNGQLTYFHPIHFLMWMTFHTNTRLRVLAKGRTKAELKKLREQERKAAEERKQRGEFPEDDDHEAGEFDDELSDVRDPSEVLQDLWELSSLPGEWQRRER